MTNTHLPEHPHAFLIDNKVAYVAIFAEQDCNGELPAQIAEAQNYDSFVSCCTQGVVPEIGIIFDNNKFLIPIVPKPTGPEYE